MAAIVYPNQYHLIIKSSNYQTPYTLHYLSLKIFNNNKKEFAALVKGSQFVVKLKSINYYESIKNRRLTLLTGNENYSLSLIGL